MHVIQIGNRERLLIIQIRHFAKRGYIDEDSRFDWPELNNETSDNTGVLIPSLQPLDLV